MTWMRLTKVVERIKNYQMQTESWECRELSVQMIVVYSKTEFCRHIHVKNMYYLFKIIVTFYFWGGELRCIERKMKGLYNAPPSLNHQRRFRSSRGPFVRSNKDRPEEDLFVDWIMVWLVKVLVEYCMVCRLPSFDLLYIYYFRDWGSAVLWSRLRSF